MLLGLTGALTLSPKPASDLPALRAEHSRLHERQEHARRVVRDYLDENPDGYAGMFAVKEAAGFLSPEENQRMLWLQVRIEEREAMASR